MSLSVADIDRATEQIKKAGYSDDWTLTYPLGHPPYTVHEIGCNLRRFMLYMGDMSDLLGTNPDYECICGANPT